MLRARCPGKRTPPRRLALRPASFSRRRPRGVVLALGGALRAREHFAQALGEKIPDARDAWCVAHGFVCREPDGEAREIETERYLDEARIAAPEQCLAETDAAARTHELPVGVRIVR